MKTMCALRKSTDIIVQALRNQIYFVILYLELSTNYSVLSVYQTALCPLESELPIKWLNCSQAI
jgi:hypothetical protein